MTTNPESDIDIPIACTLSAADARAQVLEWAELRELATSVTAIDGGVQMVFHASTATVVEDLARREAACCAFLDITTTGLEGQIALQVTTADTAALPVIAVLAGIEIA